MSAAVHVYLSSLFGLSERSDCTLEFVLPTENTTNVLGKRRRASDDEGLVQHNDVATISDEEPVPAKQPDDSSSEAVHPKQSKWAMFAGLFYRRRKRLCQQPNGPSSEAMQPKHSELKDPCSIQSIPGHLNILCGGSERFRAQAKRWTQAPGPSGKPLLRVPFDSSDDLPDALGAVRFMYSGKLHATDPVALLRLRRLAAYLQVEGCVQACDEALAAYVASSTALAGVAEIYACRHHLQEVAQEPIFMQLQHACQEKLLKHSTAPLPEGSAKLGELLAWAFGNAPSVLSNAESCKNIKALPAPALEALLGSAGFATDNEASVLVMLGSWIAANLNTANSLREQLCRQIRLCQLSDVYLHAVLPELSWLIISADEYRFLCQYVVANENKRAELIFWASDTKTYDCTVGWYSTTSRPPLCTPRLYEWIIDREELVGAINSVAKKSWLFGKVADSPDGKVAANGFTWSPVLQVDRENVKAKVSLACKELRNINLPLALACPGAVELVLYEWRSDGTRKEAWTVTFDKDKCIPVGYGRGATYDLIAEGQRDTASDPLAA